MQFDRFQQDTRQNHELSNSNAGKALLLKPERHGGVPARCQAEVNISSKLLC